MQSIAAATTHAQRFAPPVPPRLLHLHLLKSRLVDHHPVLLPYRHGHQPRPAAQPRHRPRQRRHPPERTRKPRMTSRPSRRSSRRRGFPGRRRRLRGRVPEPRRRGTSRGVYHRPRFTVVVRHRARLAALRTRRLRPDENAGARGGIVPLDDVRRRADASVVLEFGSFFERFRVRRFLVALGRARVPIVGRRVRRWGGSPACFVVTREHVSSGIDVVAARLRRRDLDGRRWVGEEPRDW